MKAEIQKEVFEKFHKKFMVGMLVCEGINNQGKSEETNHMLGEIENYVKLNFNPITIKTHNLITVWKAAVEEFGKVEHYESSVEKLIKTILDGKKIERKNKILDLCNFVSLKHIVPVDTLDLDLIEGDLSFKVKGKEIMLAEGGIVLSKKLAYQRNTKFDARSTTKKALVYLEALPPVTEEQVRDILMELGDLVTAACGGRTKIYLLDNKNMEIKLS